MNLCLHHFEWIHLLAWFFLVDKGSWNFPSDKRGQMHAYATPTGKVRIILMKAIGNTWTKTSGRVGAYFPFFMLETFVRLLHSSHGIVC